MSIILIGVSVRIQNFLLHRDSILTFWNIFFQTLKMCLNLFYSHRHGGWVIFTTHKAEIILSKTTPLANICSSLQKKKKIESILTVLLFQERALLWSGSWFQQAENLWGFGDVPKYETMSACGVPSVESGLHVLPAAACVTCSLAHKPWHKAQQ